MQHCSLNAQLVSELLQSSCCGEENNLLSMSGFEPCCNVCLALILISGNWAVLVKCFYTFEG
jgi:hypothetical protein